jgi:hypothetical protein
MFVPNIGNNCMYVFFCLFGFLWRCFFGGVFGEVVNCRSNIISMQYLALFLH